METIEGHAKVVDADDIVVNSIKIRLCGLDSPEQGQLAVKDDDISLNHGRYVKDKLFRLLHNEYVMVEVRGTDKYDRVLGVVYKDGEDINRWLVRNGYAIAAYSDCYRNDQKEAQRQYKGMWAYKKAYDPREWRHGKRKILYNPYKDLYIREKADKTVQSPVGNKVLIILLSVLALFILLYSVFSQKPISDSPPTRKNFSQSLENDNPGKTSPAPVQHTQDTQNPPKLDTSKNSSFPNPPGFLLYHE